MAEHKSHQSSSIRKTGRAQGRILWKPTKLNTSVKQPKCSTWKSKRLRSGIMNDESVDVWYVRNFGLPSGKLSRNYGNHHFSWENPLFLWPFSIAFCMSYQRVHPLNGSHYFPLLNPVSVSALNRAAVGHRPKKLRKAGALWRGEHVGKLTGWLASWIMLVKQ